MLLLLLLFGDKVFVGCSNVDVLFLFARHAMLPWQQKFFFFFYPCRLIFQVKFSIFSRYFVLDIPVLTGIKLHIVTKNKIKLYPHFCSDTSCWFPLCHSNSAPVSDRWQHSFLWVVWLVFSCLCWTRTRCSASHCHNHTVYQSLSPDSVDTFWNYEYGLEMRRTINK